MVGVKQKLSFRNICGSLCCYFFWSIPKAICFIKPDIVKEDIQTSFVLTEISRFKTSKPSSLCLIRSVRKWRLQQTTSHLNWGNDYSNVLHVWHAFLSEDSIEKRICTLWPRKLYNYIFWQNIILYKMGGSPKTLDPNWTSLWFSIISTVAWFFN